MGKDDFDLLICDIVMPNKEGWQVLKGIRSNQNMRDILAIFLTVKNEDPDMFKGYDLGSDYYMTKPFTKAQLLYGLKLMFINSPLKRYQPGTMNGKDTFFRDSFKSP